MDNIKREEQQNLDGIMAILNSAREELLLRLGSYGSSTLDRLKELRENFESGTDFELFIQQLHEKNDGVNLKDKFKRVEELEYLIKEPYFSRMDLTDPQTKEEDRLYIGKFGYTEDKPIITDWRSKIASIYYRYRYPQKGVKYIAPFGDEVYKDLNLKRTFEIESGEIVKYYNNDIQLDENEIIVDKIETRTGGVLEDIVETIQEGQLDIIEADPRQLCIVQGCVGSGKSTVAIHKLAHIFFNFPESIHAEKSILIAKNQILVGYLSTLFPKLGIFDVTYKTLRDLMIHMLYREGLFTNVAFDESEDTSDFTLKDIEEARKKIQFVHMKYEDQIIAFLKTPEFESYASYKYDHTITPYENLNELSRDIEEEIEYQRDVVKELGSESGSMRVFLAKEHIKTLKKIVNSINKWREDLVGRDLNILLADYGIILKDKEKKISYLQALIYLFLYTQLIGLKKFQKYEYAVIDEAQDFSVLEYAVISKIIMRGRMSLFGDLNQSLEADGITSWDDILKVIDSAKTATRFELKINYRSTKPIIDLANKILEPYTKDYLPQSINRKGIDPSIMEFMSHEELLSNFEDEIKGEVKDLNKSIGIIAMNEKMYNSAKDIILRTGVEQDKFIELDSTSKIKYIPRGIYLMNFEDCKGLEFAKVYILDLNLDKISTFPDARKAFVGVTRAMNEVSVYGTK